MGAHFLQPPNQDLRGRWGELQGPRLIEELAGALWQGRRVFAEALCALRKWPRVLPQLKFGDDAEQRVRLRAYRDAIGTVIRCARIAHIIREGTEDVAAVCRILHAPRTRPSASFRSWVRTQMLTFDAWAGFAPGPAGGVELVDYFVDGDRLGGRGAMPASATLIAPLARPGTYESWCVRLTIERLPHSAEDETRDEWFCDPFHHWSLVTDHLFDKAVKGAYAYVQSFGRLNAHARWRLEPYAGNFLEVAYGSSVGAGFGLALWKLFPPAKDPQAADWLARLTLNVRVAASATLSEKGQLGEVAEVPEKVAVAAGYSHYFLGYNTPLAARDRKDINVVDPLWPPGTVSEHSGGRPRSPAPATLRDGLRMLVERQATVRRRTRLTWAAAALFILVGLGLFVPSGDVRPVDPRPTPSPRPSPSPSPSDTPTITPTSTPTHAATPTPTPVPTSTPTPSPTSTPTAPPTPRPSPTSLPRISLKVRFPYAGRPFELRIGPDFRRTYRECALRQGPMCTVTVDDLPRGTSEERIEIWEGKQLVACTNWTLQEGGLTEVFFAERSCK